MMVRTGEALAMITCDAAPDNAHLCDNRNTNMSTSRPADRAGREITQQHKTRQATLSREQLDEFKLTHLLEFIEQLEQTPAGLADIRRRTRLFGECIRFEGETTGRFHGRLRFWLDRNLPQTQSNHPAQWQAYD